MRTHSFLRGATAAANDATSSSVPGTHLEVQPTESRRASRWGISGAVGTTTPAAELVTTATDVVATGDDAGGVPEVRGKLN